MDDDAACVLSPRRVRVLIGSQVLSLVGGNVHAAALGWLLFDQRGASGLAWFALFRFAPGVLSVIFLAHRFDRVDRRVSVVVVNVVQVVVGSVFAVVWFVGVPSLFAVAVYLCVYSSLASLDGVSFGALLSVSAPPGTAHEAVASMAVGARVAALAGMAAAGPIVAWCAPVVFLVNAVTFIPAACAAWLYGMPGCAAARLEAMSARWRDARVELVAALGVRRAWVVGVFTFFVAIPAVIAPLAAGLTGWGPFGVSAVGVSMTASSLVANAVWRRKSASLRGLVVACLVASVGLCLIPVGHVGTVVGAALFSASMSVVLLCGSRASAATSERVRARAAGIWSLMMNASVAVAGPVALAFSVFGPAGPFVWCAAAATAAAASAAVVCR